MAILRTLLYLLLTFFLMGILIFVHELGHYLTARLCHVTIYEFSLGMGKRLLGFTSPKTGIKYSLRLLPIGGYVSMAGEDQDKEGEEGDPNAFNKKNPWQRLLILVAGAAMNVLTGALAMLILVGGMTLAGYKLPSTTVAEFVPGASSYVTGLEKGDKILRVDGVRVHTGYDLSYEIMFKGYRPLDLVVEREGKELLVPQVVFPSGVEEGVELGSMDFYILSDESTPGNVLKTTWFRSVSSVKMVFDSIAGILTGRFTISSMSGPIGVSSAVAEVASQPLAVWNVLYLFALIAMNLGVMNMLPIPALDGGRVFFRILEILRFGKPINPKFEAMVHGVGMTLLLIFTAVIACKDLFQLF